MIDAVRPRHRSERRAVRAAPRVDALPRYQHVRADGRFLPDRQVLLDNMPSSAGKPGFRVLTPFERDGRRTAAAGRSRLGAARRVARRASSRRGRYGAAHRRRPTRRTARTRRARRRGRRDAVTQAGRGCSIFPGSRTWNACSAALSNPGSCCSTTAARRLRARLATGAALRAGATPRLRGPVVRARARTLVVFLALSLRPARADSGATDQDSQP